VEVAKLEAEVERIGPDLVQVAASNAIFGWYGGTSAWNIPAFVISAWLGATVVEVIGVVLVVVNYLFPAERREYA